MHRLFALLVVFVLVVPSVWAGELVDVKMADEITVGDATLQLNGMGLRKKMWVKVWLGDHPPSDEFKAGMLGS